MKASRQAELTRRSWAMKIAAIIIGLCLYVKLFDPSSHFILYVIGLPVTIYASGMIGYFLSCQMGWIKHEKLDQ